MLYPNLLAVIRPSNDPCGILFYIMFANIFSVLYDVGIGMLGER